MVGGQWESPLIFFFKIYRLAPFIHMFFHDIFQTHLQVHRKCRAIYCQITVHLGKPYYCNINNIFKMILNISRSIICRTRSLCTSSLRCGQIFTIQDRKDFDTKVLKSQDYVVVDFYANWCGPCKQLAPKLENIIGKISDVHLAKINVDDLDELASEHQVTTIPAVFGFKDGKVIGKFVGNKETDEIKEFVGKLRE